MNIKPIKNKDFIKAAINLYKDFWDRCWLGFDNKQNCSFEGGAEDLAMLEYCEYEIGYPEEGRDSAAIIWGNIIENNTWLIWGEDEKGNIYLFSDDEDEPSFSINVLDFVNSVASRDVTQYEKFSFLIEKLIFEMLVSGYSVDDCKKLSEIILPDQGPGCDSFAERMLMAIRDLYESKPDKLKELQKTFNDGFTY